MTLLDGMPTATTVTAGQPWPHTKGVFRISLLGCHTGAGSSDVWDFVQQFWSASNISTAYDLFPAQKATTQLHSLAVEQMW